MFAETSPKCQKILFATVHRHPGSTVGPGVHKKVKTAPAPKVKKAKPSHRRGSGAEE